MRLRALVVDDSVLYRITVSEALSAVPGIEVIGSAPNGKLAVDKILELRPDIVTLDFEMPELNGLEVLNVLKKEKLDICVIMVSSHTVAGGDVTMRALELGAFDFVSKPTEGQLAANRAELSTAFANIAKALVCHREASAPRVADASQGYEARKGAKKVQATQELSAARFSPIAKSELVVIGVSTGGPTALCSVLPGLPKDFEAPVIIVQHMPAVFTASLAKSLDTKCALRVKEAEDGEPVSVGTIYITPGGRQMKVLSTGAGSHSFKLTNDPPEQNCKPSVDYLFRSVAQGYPKKSCAVIMTGMGSDGTLGARLVKRTGGYVIAQDQATSVVFGMPKSVIEAGVVDKVCPLGEISAEIVSAVQGRRR